MTRAAHKLAILILLWTALATGCAASLTAAYTGTGKWYYIDGERRPREAVQSGQWDGAAYGSSTSTTFSLHPYASLTDEMVGWTLQPNVNAQIFLPIIAVDDSANTVSVAGNYTSLVQSASNAPHFRIFAPPGTTTYGEKAGVAMDPYGGGGVWVGAASSRCLYGGYRYEPPAAGVTQFSLSQLIVTQRQGGESFGGLYYTLHRHYDPVLMRFTSPDPAASPFFNLHAYVGNNPARFFDPDGLAARSDGLPGNSQPYEKTAPQEFAHHWFFHTEEALDDTAVGHFYVDHKRGAENHGFLGWLYGNDHYEKATGSWEAKGRAAQSGGDLFFTLLAYSAGDMLGVIDLADAGEGRDTYTGAELSDGERARRGTLGGLKFLLASLGVSAFAESQFLQMSSTPLMRGPTAPKPPKPACFVEGTQVLAADETGTATATNIEEIEVGDWVWSRNEQTGEEGFKPVVRLFRNQADTLVHLTYTTGSAPRNVETGAASASARWTFDHTDGLRIATGTRTATITGTPEHPFWSLTRHDWIGMGELKPGERLLLAGGQTATTTNVRTEHLATPVTVYNFEVADWHTYHVGTAETGWVYVHNTCTGNFLKEVARRAERKVGGTGHVAGTMKHKYAEKLINRYQRRFAPVGKGLHPEISFKGGVGNVPYGTKGSVRIDVVEGNIRNPVAGYDFKFGSARLRLGRIARIRRETGWGPNVPISEVRP